MAGINFSGFNGFDFGQIIDVTIQSESRPLQALQAQEKSLKDKDSAFSGLATAIGRMQTQVNSLISETIFSNVDATSSNTDVATVTLGDEAIAGEYSLNVTQLAKGQVTSSTNGYSATSDVAATGGSISFTIDGDTTDPITISASTTLAELKDAINNQSSDVVASIVNDGTNYKLVISSRTTGESNGFTINNSLTNSPGAAVAFAVGQSPTVGNSQDAQDAEFTVNGLSITSALNTVTEAIPGVSVKLADEGAATIEVTADYDTLKETLKTLVTEYNKIREGAVKQNTVDPLTGKRGPLGNDTVMRQAINDVRSVLLGSNANGGRFQYLTEIGLEFTQTGELKLNETTYDDAIGSYASDVQTLFQGTDSVDGVFDDLKSRLDNLDGTAGIIKTTRDTIDTTLKSYRDRIASQQMRLEIRRLELQRMYAAADQAMSKLNSMSSQLQGLGSRAF